jgi:hypothetical protein
MSIKPIDLSSPEFQTCLCVLEKMTQAQQLHIAMVMATIGAKYVRHYLRSGDLMTRVPPKKG